MDQVITRVRVANLEKMVAYYQKVFHAELIDSAEISACLMIGSELYEFVETTQKAKRGYVGIQFDSYDGFHRTCARLGLDFRCTDGVRYLASMEDIEGNAVQLHYYQMLLAEGII